MKWLLALLGACGSARTDPPAEPAPSIDVTAVTRERLCVTRGAIEAERITEPTVRAIARSSRGDAAVLAFRYLGPSKIKRELASGDARQQVGLKLHAQDGCNVVYVMWRSDKTKLDVSVKLNPGKHTHLECGAEGYTKVVGKTNVVPALGGVHALRAELTGDELTAWVDGHVAWRGELPASARTLTGPSGFRTDNVEIVLQQFSASPDASVTAGCPTGSAVSD